MKDTTKVKNVLKRKLLLKLKKVILYNHLKIIPCSRYLWAYQVNGNPLQYSCLENPMGRGAWLATVHGVTRAGHDLEIKPGGTSGKEPACPRRQM